MATSAPPTAAQGAELAHHASGPPPPASTPATTGARVAHKPTAMDKFIGSLQHSLGRAMKNTKMEREGEARKTGGKEAVKEVNAQQQQQGQGQQQTTTATSTTAGGAGAGAPGAI